MLCLLDCTDTVTHLQPKAQTTSLHRAHLVKIEENGSLRRGFFFLFSLLAFFQGSSCLREVSPALSPFQIQFNQEKSETTIQGLPNLPKRIVHSFFFLGGGVLCLV